MNKHHARNYRGLLAASLACVLTTPVWAAQPAQTDPVREEIKAVLQKHDEAMDKQDLKALLSLYADDPTIAMMGTGPGEFWKGKAAVEDTYKHYFETFKPGSLSHECPEVAWAEEGKGAWLMASCVMKDTDPAGQPREFGLNVSAVLKKEKAGWRFQAMHFSNLVGEGAPPPEGAAPAAAPAPAPQAAPKKAQ